MDPVIVAGGAVDDAELAAYGGRDEIQAMMLDAATAVAGALNLPKREVYQRALALQEPKKR